jgi:hypothetical protein
VVRDNNENMANIPTIDLRRELMLRGLESTNRFGVQLAELLTIRRQAGENTAKMPLSITAQPNEKCLPDVDPMPSL